MQWACHYYLTIPQPYGAKKLYARGNNTPSCTHYQADSNPRPRKYWPDQNSRGFQGMPLLMLLLSYTTPVLLTCWGASYSCSLSIQLDGIPFPAAIDLACSWFQRTCEWGASRKKSHDEDALNTHNIAEESTWALCSPPASNPLPLLRLTHTHRHTHERAHIHAHTTPHTHAHTDTHTHTHTHTHNTQAPASKLTMEHKVNNWNTTMHYIAV